MLLSAFGTRVHAAAVRVLFTSITLPDDVRCFLALDVPHIVSRHPLSAIISNPDRYARAVKRISVMDAGLPPPFGDFETGGLSGLVVIDEEDSDSQGSSDRSRVGVQPMPARNLNQLLTLCTNLEEFAWCSSNPPPDGVCEV